MGEPIVAPRAVIALDIGVLLRLSGLDEVNADAALGGPDQRHGADVLRGVIATNDQWLASPFDDSVERLDHPFRRQREASQYLSTDTSARQGASRIQRVIIHPNSIDLPYCIESP